MRSALLSTIQGMACLISCASPAAAEKNVFTLDSTLLLLGRVALRTSARRRKTTFWKMSIPRSRSCLVASSGPAPARPVRHAVKEQGPHQPCLADARVRVDEAPLQGWGCCC